MKRIFCLVLISAAFLSAQDDVGLGTFSLGGGVSSTSTKIQGDDKWASSYVIGPEFYIFLSRFFALGGVLNFNYYKHDDTSIIGFGNGPGLKFYIPFHRKFKMYFGAQYLYNQSQMTYKYYYYYYNDVEVKQTYSNWDISATIGFDIFIAKNVALEPYINFRRDQSQLKYEYDAYDQDNTQKNPFTLSISEGLRIAVFIF
jgi:hypothetical protein